MRALIQDLKGSKPFVVGLTYVLAGACLLAAAGAAFPAVGAPPWALRLMFATLVIVFPFVVTLTWALSAGPPEGKQVRPRPWELQG